MARLENYYTHFKTIFDVIGRTIPFQKMCKFMTEKLRIVEKISERKATCKLVDVNFEY